MIEQCDVCWHHLSPWITWKCTKPQGCTTTRSEVCCIDPSRLPLKNKSWRRVSRFTPLGPAVHTHAENSLGNSIDQTSPHVTWSRINRQVYDHPSLLVTDHYPLWWRGSVLSTCLSWGDTSTQTLLIVWFCCADIYYSCVELKECRPACMLIIPLKSTSQGVFMPSLFWEVYLNPSAPLLWLDEVNNVKRRCHGTIRPSCL